MRRVLKTHPNCRDLPDKAPPRTLMELVTRARSSSIAEGNPCKRKKISPQTARNMAQPQSQEQLEELLAKQVYPLEHTLESLNDFIQANRNVHREVKSIATTLNQCGYEIQSTTKALHEAGKEARHRSEKDTEELLLRIRHLGERPQSKHAAYVHAETQTASEQEVEEEAKIRTLLEGMQSALKSGDWKQVLDKWWPERVFEHMAEEEGNPLSERRYEDCAIFFTNSEVEKSNTLQRHFIDRFGDIDKTRRINHFCQTNKTWGTREVRSTDTHAYGVILSANPDNDDVLKAIRQIRAEMEPVAIKKILIPKITGIDGLRLRKLVELAWHDTSLQATIYVPKGTKASRNKKEASKPLARERKTEAILIDLGDAPYKDALQKVRDNLATYKHTPVIKNIRQTSDGNLLIVLPREDKGENQNLKAFLGSNLGGDLKIRETKSKTCAFQMRNLDEVTTTKEIEGAIRGHITLEPKDLTISVRPAGRRTHTAEVRVPETHKEPMLRLKSIRIC